VTPEWLGAISTALSAIAAFTAVIVAWLVWKGQKDLGERTNKNNEELTKRTNELQERIQNATNELQKQISDKERLLMQRAQLVPLWQYWASIRNINPKASATVVNAVNILELVALCWEADIIDRAIVQRTFSDTFMNIYKQIEACTDLDMGPDQQRKSGKGLLEENRATRNFYRYLEEKRLRAHRITRLN
jgi:hypothetical protein